MSVSFDEWMQGATVYVSWDRYSNFGNGFVAVSSYIDDDNLRDAVEDLEGGDNDMAIARKHIEMMVSDGKAWLGAGRLPSDAILGLESVMREYHRSIS